MNPAVRLILAILVGMVVAFFSVAGIEAIGHAVYPTAAGLDMSSPEAVRAFMQTVPTGALAFVLAAWILGTFLGGLVGSLIARPRARVVSGVIGALVLAATIANLAMIPHPMWMAVSGVVGIALAAFAAGKLMSSPAAKVAG